MAELTGTAESSEDIELKQPGTVAVVGMGKIGMPLAAQYLSAGWSVIGVDVAPAHVGALNQGRANLDGEPNVPELIRQGHAEGRFEATLSHAEAASRADVVVMIVPLMLDDRLRPDYRAIDAATEAVGRGLRRGSLVLYETTLPIGDTRRRFGPLLERSSGLAMGSEHGFLLAFSPERVYSGHVLADLNTWPKLVGGIDPLSLRAAASFYRSVLSADVWEMPSAEEAEFAKLAETTYRDVNIALANEFARCAEVIDADILAVIEAANSQPYSHIHQPGVGVGGHCIPVYPHFLLVSRDFMTLPRVAREINDSQPLRAVQRVEDELAGLSGKEVLVLGLTYRQGVRELAHSQGLALLDLLFARGAVVSAFDPLLSSADVASLGAVPYEWGASSSAAAVITQTLDPLWNSLDLALFPSLRAILDGRNSLRHVVWPSHVRYLGVGLGPGRR